jgi:hypothetical protein
MEAGRGMVTAMAMTGRKRVVYVREPPGEEQALRAVDIGEHVAADLLDLVKRKWW